MAFVFGEAGTKFLTEEGFFAAGLDVKREPSDGHCEQGTHFAEVDGGSEKREKNPGENGMTIGAVGTRPNQSVAFLEGDHSAPIRAQMPASPKGHPDSGAGPQHTNPCGER